MAWRVTPVLRGGGFRLLLHYSWIKKVGGCCCVAPGLLGRYNKGLQFVPMFSSACGFRERLVLFLLSSTFQSWGQAQKSKMAVMFNKVIGLLGKWCHNSKWGWLYSFNNECQFHFFVQKLISTCNTLCSSVLFWSKESTWSIGKKNWTVYLFES